MLDTHTDIAPPIAPQKAVSKSIKQAHNVFCALDLPSTDDARRLLTKIIPYIGGIKIGMEFFYALDRADVYTIAQIAANNNLPIFLDLKLHDIPNTVARAIEALAPLKPAILNVHASGGHDMMRAAREACHMHLPDTKLVAVTLLTSLSQAELTHGTPQEHVLRLAAHAHDAQLDGVVCSAHEITALRNAFGKDFYLIVPGIRPDDIPNDEQKRTMTPRAAQNAGADILVIGRPITQADNPANAARNIAAQLAE